MALGAIATQNRSFDQALVALPGALRQANTTFHNLRPALDDLDVLVNAAKPATKNLPTFLRDLKPVTTRSVPVFNDLAPAVNLKGKSNDLADATGDLPALQKRAAEAIPITVQALQDSQPNLAVPASLHAGPDGGRSPTSTRSPATTTRTRHYLRVAPVGLGVFSPTPAACKTVAGSTCTFAPQNASTVFNDYGALGGTNFELFHRCPGGADRGPRRQQPVLTSPPALPRARPSAHRRAPDSCNPTARGAGPMRRIALIAAGLLLAALLIALPAIGSNGASGTYLVRGYFDNGSFVVSGEEVRVAGATVGTVQVGRRLERRRDRQPRGRPARGSRQGRRRHGDRRLRLQGLPPGRQLPDPPAVADRREVHRLHPDPAARARDAAAARSCRRSPTARPVAASTCCRSRTTARPSTST